MRFGLLGRSLSHSYSPQIHALLGGYEYSLFEKEPNEVERFITSDEFDGLNVTIPYKQTVIPLMSQLSEAAKKIGAVNTVTRLPDGGLFGDNTDCYGFTYLLERAGLNVAGKKVLVLGSGGASKTAVCVCRDLGANEVTVISRSGENNYENISKHSAANFIINATPVGMYPLNGASPVDLKMFSHLEGVADMVYNPAKTALLLQAEKLEIPFSNGLPMLCAQAVKAAESFTGEHIDTRKTESVIKQIEKEMLNVVLIGMPGCGKTTAASLLDETLGREALDTDALVVKEQGMAIEQIFVERGEEYFRAAETRACEQAGKQSGKIIATGGGAVLRQANVDSLRQNGRVVFLQRDVSLLETAGRPLSKNCELTEMYKKRLPFYKAACDIEIAVSDNAATTVQRILKGLEAE